VATSGAAERQGPWEGGPEPAGAANGYALPPAASSPGNAFDDAARTVTVSPEAPPPPRTAPDGETLRSSRAPGFTDDSDRRQQP